MDDEPPIRRLREPVKRTPAEPFVKVPLWWAKQMTAATKTKKALVGIVLLHTAWKTRRLTFPLPNGQLTKFGVSRETKRRALLDFERVGLIVVERPSRKAPIVTMVAL
jgi:hypothetical protein